MHFNVSKVLRIASEMGHGSGDVVLHVLGQLQLKKTTSTHFLGMITVLVFTFVLFHFILRGKGGLSRLLNLLLLRLDIVLLLQFVQIGKEFVCKGALE